VVRARRVQGRGDDSVVKLRPVDPQDLPRALRRSSAFSVEVDAMPGGYVCSGSMVGRLDADVVTGVASGETPIRRLFTKEQREFFKRHAPDGIGLDDLTVLGPIMVLKLKFTPEVFERRLVAELWLYPDGSRLLELSTKCKPADAFRAAAETRAFLGQCGVDLTGDQATKTRRALEVFAQRAS